MKSNTKLRIAIAICIVALTISVGYAWFIIGQQNLPATIGNCMIGVMLSMYIMGLAFDRYRRDMYLEAMRLYNEEHMRAETLDAKVHCRDATIRLQNEKIARFEAAEQRAAKQTLELNTRINTIVNTLNNAIDTGKAKNAPPHRPEFIPYGSVNQ